MCETVEWYDLDLFTRTHMLAPSRALNGKKPKEKERGGIFLNIITILLVISTHFSFSCN